jgi:hypothetical protein
LDRERKSLFAGIKSEEVNTENFVDKQEELLKLSG